MISAHVVIAGHDNNAIPITSNKALREPRQKTGRLIILLTQALLRLRGGGTDSLNNVATNNNQIGGADFRVFFGGEMAAIVFKRVKQYIVPDRIIPSTV